MEGRLKIRNPGAAVEVLFLSEFGKGNVGERWQPEKRTGKKSNEGFKTWMSACNGEGIVQYSGHVISAKGIYTGVQLPVGTHCKTNRVYQRKGEIPHQQLDTLHTNQL